MKSTEEKIEELEKFAQVVGKTMTSQATAFQELVNSFNEFKASIMESIKTQENSIQALSDTDTKLLEIIKKQGNSLQSFADTDKSLIERIQWIQTQIAELNKNK
jgi:predicted  nucleic acid-binding Zn-ribbon protein